MISRKHSRTRTTKVSYRYESTLALLFAFCDAFLGHLSPLNVLSSRPHTANNKQHKLNNHLALLLLLLLLSQCVMLIVYALSFLQQLLIIFARGLRSMLRIRARTQIKLRTAQKLMLNLNWKVNTSPTSALSLSPSLAHK